MQLWSSEVDEATLSCASDHVGVGQRGSVSDQLFGSYLACTVP